MAVAVVEGNYDPGGEVGNLAHNPTVGRRLHLLHSTLGWNSLKPQQAPLGAFGWGINRLSHPADSGGAEFVSRGRKCEREIDGTQAKLRLGMCCT